ncbi:hypothetical protein CC1G_09834 [Coprinopsis cinerea okayama7|uniref:Xylanolytic transcriptional activator regulatory domain-containing protein n=1 Tax=Coprinopsis cinerea (strain Okayama-7 / 130 / ATCC MYA-4618 / FGSC 9003) TaxID=240176 RepID=A8P0B5_COPC7|nr:hypothetical protein CC1G_09834 [Coprinopsis cinerea okayama7\|eukprot:XP_001837852.2 hypothetical protein CC1G_09834 [Coprinopsis cinerea okayama7\
MSYSDEYDNASDLAEIVGDPGHGVNFGDGAGSGQGNDKTVRRRSSKACDQCRKSKCKCERSGPNEPCKSCILLGTRPSRKRGPPKGYIDAIEARLHQTEALVGIMLATKDPRARSLLEDMAKDPLGREIINRVDNSPYGVKGRKRDGNPAGTKARPGGNSGSESATPDGTGKIDLTSTHPSNEWQDRVVAMLDSAAGVETVVSMDSENDSAKPTEEQKEASASASGSKVKSPLLRIDPNRPASTETQSSDDNQSPGRRQRRRIGEHEFSSNGLPYPSSANASAASLVLGPNSVRRRGRGYSHTYSSLSPVNPIVGDRRSSSVDSLSSDSEDELAGAVGQLSLNEDEQVRYHGKASGLHILNDKERVDGRNEGGIWRFPKARVWPLAAPNSSATLEEEALASYLPSEAVQERLLNLYFRFIHSAFPVIHKRAFFEAHRKGHQNSSITLSDSENSEGALSHRRRQRVPTLLLLTMFSLAARYDETTPLPPDPSLMWSAGDEYLDKAKLILDKVYSSSRPSTCQALLLMGYREVGIGAMAQAWTYIGMAIRMAQDLGMHRSADGWARVVLGGRLFNEWELQERKRIWYGCVIMDKYVSTYIGRPLMIFERDFDTPLPSEDDPEEMEDWPVRIPQENPNPIPCHRISCFNASSILSGILSTIVQAIYAVRPVSSRHAEALVLEGILDKWYLELPEHLRYDSTATNKQTPLPHILTLHMQYCIRPVYNAKQKGDGSEDPEALNIATKSYELCAGAANHITSIITAYAEKYPLNRCSVFLCYYLFTASIMHITTLTTHPSDPQAPLGLKKCMDALEMIETVWPSAARALELLRGAKVNLQGSEIVAQPQGSARPKRAAPQPLDDTAHLNGRYFNPPADDPPSTRPHSLGTNYIYPTTASFAPHTPSTNHQSHNPASVLSPLSAPSPTANYRWHSEDFHSHHSFNNNAPLSTSVLPQLYSTGFGDDRAHVPSSTRVQSHGDQNGQASSNRYPQYWNDYSTFPQLGQAYTGLSDQPNSTSHQPLSPHMYMQEHYNLYNTQPFPDR